MKWVRASPTTIVALALVARPIPALASDCEEEAGSIAAHIFDMSDSDADGYLSPDEFARYTTCGCMQNVWAHSGSRHVPWLK